MLASELIAQHVRRHKRASRKIRSAIRPFFEAQTRWILSTIGTDGTITPESVGQGFDPVSAHAALTTRLSTALIAIAEGSTEEVMDEFAQPFRLETRLFKPLADTVLMAITSALSADWWFDVAAGGVDAAKEIVARTIAKSGIITNLAKFKAMLGTRLRRLARQRVRAIADSEANSAINAGRQAAGNALELVAVDKKTWVTMDDLVVRPTHRALHITAVPVGTDFNVGGSPAPHPGHWTLPIAQRIFCRCFLTFGDVEDDIVFPIPESILSPSAAA